MTTFSNWLRQQRTRDDSIGDLARDSANDSTWPGGDDVDALRRHLASHAGAAVALEDAWNEFVGKTPALPSMPTSLYRLYDDADLLLYIGIAGNPGRRFEQHKSDKRWWGEVARIDLVHYPDRSSAAEAERFAIIDEYPMHNVIHSVRTPGIDTIVVVCAACTAPINDGDGFVEVDESEVDRRRQAVTEYEDTQRARGPWAEHDFGAFMRLHPRAMWLAHHRRCDPNPDGPMYTIDVERIRTWQEVVHWTAHLMEKRWLRYTNWREVLALLASDAADGPLLSSKAHR